MSRATLVIAALAGFTGAACARTTVMDTLIYTHAAHEQKYKVGGCEVCHVSITTSTKARDDNYADDQSCNKAGCHDIKNQDSCFVCHTNSAARSPRKPKREIRFNHKAHADKSIGCRDCHGYIDKTAYFTRRDMPAMRLCTECHEQKRVVTTCEYCHTDPALIMSHGTESGRRHGDLYFQSPRSCETCHENNHCDKCHQGQMAADVHPVNYVYLHQFDAFGSSDRCVSCHDIRQSCDGCHQRSWGRMVNHRDVVKGSQSCTTCHRGK